MILPTVMDVPMFAVTVPATVCVAGKLEMETTLPLTALVILFGLKSPVLAFTIPPPDQMPPGKLAVKLKGARSWHTGTVSLICGSNTWMVVDIVSCEFPQVEYKIT